MSVLYLLLPLALVLAAGFVLVFVWAARSGQFDDLETPAIRMLHDDPIDRQPDEANAGGPAPSSSATSSSATSGPAPSSAAKADETRAR